MTLPVNEIVYTGTRWLCQKIYIESSGDGEIDKALKSTFHDQFHRTAPLRMARADVQIVLAHRNKIIEGVPVKEQRKGQMALFEK